MRDEDVNAVHMKKLNVTYMDDKLIIGESPKLVIDLKNQNNYIEMNGRKLPYHREMRLSRDLLEGKREQVFNTAINHYYEQACSVAEGVERAEKYRQVANLTVREVK